ncbi:3beta-hydroxysteroid-dehydrogenase/decarboxylase [Arachis duranensis]|uniref:Reticulon-like protein n=1 Tax=Arachis duranensis TaxID=130453 RepID=A0A6P4CJC8_ARADU|nr:3beta-hydroxysteroid-dehydrogenase/decarboxylase [Arachis duranensis]
MAAAVDDRFADLQNPKTCVVLGGRGFLGRSLVLKLLNFGNWIVRVADSAESIQLHASESLLSDALSSARASYFHLELRDKLNVAKVLEGASVVFYMDVAGLNPNYFYSCYTLIVQGAKNVISACRECKVKRLIYNSSADVVFDGFHDIHNGDESLPYPWKIENVLSDFKAQAEALILSANDIDGLLTCALRPCNVFGPGDTEFVPFFLDLARFGFAKYIIGTGDNMSDFTFYENVAHAHICAEEALNFQTVSVAGKAFFITNFEPMKFWEFLSLLLEGLGYQRPLTKLPVNLVQFVLSVLKWMHDKLGSGGFSYPLLVHFFQLATHTRTFSCTAARRELAYLPIISLEEGITLTIDSFSHLARELSISGCCDSTEQSKAAKLLGGGKVADVLLWRNEKTSFACFIVMVLLFYWSFLSGSTFISSAAKFLMLVTFLLFGWGTLPANLFGFQTKRISSSSFKISNSEMKGSVTTTVNQWNNNYKTIRRLRQGEDWLTFFKIAIPLYFLKLILSAHKLTTFVGIGLVFAFTAFFIYEQYQSEIDLLAEILFAQLNALMRYLMRVLSDLTSRLLQKFGKARSYKEPEVKELR